MQLQSLLIGILIVMPKKAKELSAVELKRIDKPGMYAVGGVSGLLLQVSKGGSRSWILRTRIGEQRRHVGLGGFPDVTLANARDKAREVREQIRQGTDPIAQRENARQVLIIAQRKRLTFTEAARRKHAAISHEFKTAKHSKWWWSSLERYALPAIGDMEVAEIELAHVLKVLEPIWNTKTPTAKKVRQRLESVLTWATVSGYRNGENPARWRGNLKEVLPQPNKIHRTQNHPALVWHEMPTFMAALRKRKGTATRALEFAILTAARSDEVRDMTWNELDAQASTWLVSAEDMKGDKVHTVPLSTPALEILKAQPRMLGSEYVFPATRGGKVSDMSLTEVVRRMHNADVKAGGNGYIDPKQNRRITVHGFRSSFKDWARSRTSFADEVSELALAHVNSDATRAAYARDELLPQRKRLMDEWAQFCASPGVESATVTPIGEART